MPFRTRMLNRITALGAAMMAGVVSLGWTPNHTAEIAPVPIWRSPRYDRAAPSVIAWFFRRRSSLYSAPHWSYGGAARGGCAPGAPPLVPLVPVDARSGDYPAFIGATAQASPTFYAYVPETEAAALTFLLKSNAPIQEVLYETEVALGNTPAVVPVPLPITLEVDQSYVWTFGLECDALDPSGNPFVEGTVERVAVGADIQAIANLPLSDRPQRYAAVGLWYETLETVVARRCREQDSPTAQTDWQDMVYSLELDRIPDLLSKVQPDAIAQAPISACEE